MIIQENKNRIVRIPPASRTAVFQKAYSEIEDYILTKRTPKAQEKPGEAISEMNKKCKRKDKKNDKHVLIMEVQ